VRLRGIRYRLGILDWFRLCGDDDHAVEFQFGSGGWLGLDGLCGAFNRLGDGGRCRRGDDGFYRFQWILRSRC